MEHAFGHDFSAIRIIESNRPSSLGAAALATGDEIHVSPGATPSRALLAHELTHVVQQRSGRARSGTTGDSHLEQEASSTGEIVGRGGRAPKLSSGYASSCGCRACRRTTSGPSPVQLGGCAFCGSNKHSTNKCHLNTKEHRDAHKPKVEEFQAAKAKTLQANKQADAPAVSAAFEKKHVATTNKAIRKKGDETSATRGFGGGGGTGLSTTIVMTPAEQNFERDAGVASATMKGSRVEGDRVVLTVNKPTVGDYPTRTDIVTTDATGKRTVQPG